MIYALRMMEIYQVAVQGWQLIAFVHQIEVLQTAAPKRWTYREMGLWPSPVTDQRWWVLLCKEKLDSEAGGSLLSKGIQEAARWDEKVQIRLPE